MDIKQIFAGNVRRLRLQQHFTQEKFAELCGLHRTYISDIECSTRNVSLDNVQKIASALHVEPYVLFLPDDLPMTAKGVTQNEHH